jgi:hypothetical protein
MGMSTIRSCMGFELTARTVSANSAFLSMTFQLFAKRSSCGIEHKVTPHRQPCLHETHPLGSLELITRLAAFFPNVSGVGCGPWWYRLSNSTLLRSVATSPQPQHQSQREGYSLTHSFVQFRPITTELWKEIAAEGTDVVVTFQAQDINETLVRKMAFAWQPGL